MDLPNEKRPCSKARRKALPFLLAAALAVTVAASAFVAHAERGAKGGRSTSGANRHDAAGSIALPAGDASTSPTVLCQLPHGQSPNPRYGAETQRTGDPIGGGAGYRRIPAGPIAVASKSELLAALSAATSGSTVYVDDAAEIDLTGEHGIEVKPGVALASGRGRNGSRGALLFTKGRPAPLLEAGAGARITGLRLQGADRESGDHWGVPPDGRRSWAAAVSVKAAGVEVDNCEFSGWGYAGVWVHGSGPANAHVHHCYFHHNHQAGLGYGVSVDGPGPGRVSVLIEASLFDFYRHTVASSWGAFGDYEARFNVIREHGLTGVWAMDRHGGGRDAEGGTYGGGSTSIHHNTFWVTATGSMGFGDGPKEGSRGEVFGNWFFGPSQAATVLLKRNAPSRVSVHDNAFGTVPPKGTMPPVATIHGAPVAVAVGTEAGFDGSASCGFGHPIRTWTWDFGDGSGADGAKASHSFREPGRYVVELMVTDTLGVPAIARIPVEVFPAARSRLLSFWVLDSYRLGAGATFTKRVLVDGRQVWSDSAAGDEGWQHSTIDLAAALPGLPNGPHTLALVVTEDEAMPSSSCPDAFVFWDDVRVLGGEGRDGDFENGSAGWSYRTNGRGCAWDGGPVSAEARSGSYSFGFSKHCSRKSAAGCTAQASQTFVLH